MPKIKLIVEYDGTAYAGWQYQTNALTIQQVLEESLERLLGERVRVYSSGRTDAGVHARGMAACFSTARQLPLAAYAKGLNAWLPPDIAVHDAAEVADNFDPRHDARGKHYRYTIRLGVGRAPLSRLYAWHCRERLDLALMEQAAADFVGDHDFAAFRTTGCAAKRTRRRIDRVAISREGEMLIIDVFGSGFLRNMVRIMVGTLVAIGRGKLPVDRVRNCLVNPALPPGPTAPAHGLCLVEVFY